MDSYTERHWADIKSKAGVIKLVEPYIEDHKREYKEHLNSKKNNGLIKKDLIIMLVKLQ